MFSIEPFMPSDIFALDLTNLDRNTENYTIDYYLHYLLNSSDDCFVSTTSKPRQESDFLYDRCVSGYLIGKHEIDDNDELHGHVTALSISPEARVSGIGRTLMRLLEINEKGLSAKYIDLFVRVSNEGAIKFYTKLGYIIYERIQEYYSGEISEDAYDMRLYIK